MFTTLVSHAVHRRKAHFPFLCSHKDCTPWFPPQRKTSAPVPNLHAVHHKKAVSWTARTHRKSNCVLLPAVLRRALCLLSLSLSQASQGSPWIHYYWKRSLFASILTQKHSVAINSCSRANLSKSLGTSSLLFCSRGLSGLCTSALEASLLVHCT